MLRGTTVLWMTSILKCFYNVCYGVSQCPLYSFIQLTHSLDKVELVKDVIVLLSRHLQSESGIEKWVGMPIERFFKTDTSGSQTQKIAKHKPQYTSLFAEPQGHES